VKVHAAHGKEILYKAAPASAAFFMCIDSHRAGRIMQVVAQGGNAADEAS
jgi:hypothetical protein